mgnify:CR=1 FL=1|tara:strand:+ start:393 stop:617 length:225 start_codon:yes stop_codon:yes gene_type:complete
MKSSNLITHLKKKGLAKEVSMVIDNKEYSVDVVSATPEKLILSGSALAEVPAGDSEDDEVIEVKKTVKKTTKKK